MLTTVPFAGFYESLHDSNINHCLELMFDDDHGSPAYPALDERLWGACNFGKVHLDYAEAYVEAFANEFKLTTLKWGSMESPREYNFTTDRLFATISRGEVRRLKREVDPRELQRVAAAHLTSRAGFISWYDPEVSAWGPVDQWDHNLVGLLLQAHANEQYGVEFDHWAECSLCEDFSGSGHLDNWICRATPGIDRLFKVYNYLRARAARR
jgi:hypothetical protein